MVRRGAIAESDEDKRLRGNPGKRKLKPEDKETEEKKPEEKFLPPPPKHLDKFAKDEWDRMSAEMSTYGSLKKTDLTVFEFYCSAVGDVRRLREYLKKNQRYIKLRNNTFTPRPEVRELNEAIKAVQKWAPLLGLTPNSRIGLKLKPEKNESSNPGKSSQLSEIFD